MGFLRTLFHLAAVAWQGILGIPGDVADALSKVWRFAESIHALLDNLVSAVVRRTVSGLLTWNLGLFNALKELAAALARVAAWVWFHLVNPLKVWTAQQIAKLRAWTAAQLAALRALVWNLYFKSLAYTRQLVDAEHKAMLKAVAAEHAAMLAAVAALHAAIEREAATGYNAGRRARAGIVAKLLDDLAVRNPLLRALTGRLITVIVDLAAIDNPLARFAAAILIRQVINRLGIDRVIGDLAGAILGSITGHGEPKGLTDVMRDVDGRLTALENQAAVFQLHGGPEVEQAGDEWKRLTSLTTDAALLAFFTLAVADPGGWARAVADTAGAAVNDTIGGIAHALRRK